MEWMFSILLMIIVIPAAITFVVFALVKKMSAPEKLFQPITKVTMPAYQQAIAMHQDWAEEHGFEPSGAYLFNNQIFVASWQALDRAMYLCVYVARGNTIYDLVTVFEGDAGLTTTNTRDAFTLPNTPGSYKQSFPRLGLEELWEAHLAAQTYLTSKLGLQIQRAPLPLLDSIIRSMRRQMEYIQSLPFWPLHGVYGFFVNRYRMPNRTIQQQ